MKPLFYFSTLICLFIFSVSNAIGQNEDMARIDSIKVLKSVKAKVEKYNTLLTQLEQKDSPKAKGTLFHELGKCHTSLKNLHKAIDFFLKAIKIRNNLRPINLEQVNVSRYDLSKVYKKLGRMDEQNQILNSIIKEGRKDSITCRAYSDIGRNIAVKGDYHSALQYLNSVLADTELMKEVDHELIIRLKITFVYGLKYQDIFKAEKDSPDLENFEKHQVEIEKKLEKSGLDKSMYYGMLNNLATVSEAFDDGRYIALESYSKCLNYYKEDNDTYTTHLLLSNIGTVYSKLGNHEKANAYYQEVIDNAIDPDLIAVAYGNMGYFLAVDSTKEKIPYYFNAFDILLGQEISKGNSFSLPTVKEIRSSSFELEFLTFLIELASIFVESYKESKDISYLGSAKEAIHLIDQLVSQIRYESLSEESKLYWIEKGVDTYMLGVEVCYLLNSLDEAFYFMEKNKALLLQENIKTIQAKWKLDIPSNTLEREYALYYKRFDLYEKFLERPEDIESKKSYAHINQEYIAFMDSLEIRFPGYTKLKKQVQISPLDEAVTKYVTNNQCFIEYILNDNEGYGIICTAQEKLLFEIQDVNKLQSELLILKSYWTKPILKKAETEEFRKLAYSVYSKLFPFSDAIDKLSGKQITIISDQKLHHLPFEALQVRTDLDLAGSYFINCSEISYLHSISLAQEIEKKENNPKYTLLGLAPNQFHYGGLSELPKSKNTTEILTKFHSSKILIEDDATKKNFLDELNDYKIIHLNTHAGIDSFNLEPWIAFRNEKMGLSELYGKENQADLVVLDACKTNDGELALGEGIFNLSRGFFYNGTQSVLASMWNVNEQTGNVIINSFYEKLEDGNTKSKALQLAKIDYLKKHQYSDVLPYYWAAYTLTGDISPIELRRNNNLFVYMGLALLVLVLFFFYGIRRVVVSK